MEEARARLDRRLKRWELWASLWLARLLASLSVFDGAKPPPQWRVCVRAWLNRLARHLANIIVIRTAMRPEFENRATKRGHIAHSGCAATLSLRAVIGGDLRKAFRAKSLQARARKILKVLETRDALIAKLARRLRRGMTRQASAPSAIGALLHHPPRLKLWREDAALAARFGEELRAAAAPP